jgi:hypothetical protein
MKAETPSTLILCDGPADPNSYNLANGLRSYLAGPMGTVVVDIQDYAQVTRLPENLPQHLVLVYSPCSPKASQAINDALTQVVERRIRSVVAVTTATASLPPDWASIPTYEASSFLGPNNFLDQARLAQSVLDTEWRVKLPYSQAIVERSQSQSRQPVFRGRPVAHIIVPVLLSLILLILIGAASWLFLYVFPSSQQALSSVHGTATALPNPTTTPGTQVSSSPTHQSAPTTDPTQLAWQNELKNTTQPDPTIKDFQTHDGWDTSVRDTSYCAPGDNKTYVVNIAQNAKYVPCVAANTAYKNFALQVTMDISGDAGGVIFRSDTAKGSYYRLSISKNSQQSTDTPTFSLFLCNNASAKKCTANDTDSGTSLATINNVKMDQGPITLTVIARDKNIDIYADGQFLLHFTEPQGAGIGAGQVGVYAADLNNPTTVKFSNLKIWSL